MGMANELLWLLFIAFSLGCGFDYLTYGRPLKKHCEWLEGRIKDTHKAYLELLNGLRIK